MDIDPLWAILSIVKDAGITGRPARPLVPSHAAAEGEATWKGLALPFTAT